MSDIRGLLIKTPFIDKILSGKKTWEIRSSRTNIRGQIGLIRSGSGAVIGICDLVDCIGPLTRKQFQLNARKAGILPQDAVIPRGRKVFAWVLSNPRELKSSVPYVHPSGAIIWVKLHTRVHRAIMRAID